MSSKLLKKQLKQVLSHETKSKEASLRTEKSISKKAARKAKKFREVDSADQEKSTYEKNLEYYKQGLEQTLASEKAAAAMQAIAAKRDPEYAPKSNFYSDSDSD